MSKNWKRNAAVALAFPVVLIFALSMVNTPSFSAPGPMLLIEKLGEDSGFLTVTFTTQGLFSSRITETLGRGLPATLTYEIQLWKERRIWFDKLLQVNKLSYRVRYDPWEDGFLIETREGSSPAVFDLEQVERSLCFHVKGRVGSMKSIEPFAVYYVVVRATLTPLSAEDVDEVESWLSEESGEGRRGITAIPGYFFDMIVGLSGFGDEAVSVRSRPFQNDDFSSTADMKE